MSVTGATEWYVDFRKQYDTKSAPLVFGLYPLPFLREVARKHPASFYGATPCASSRLEGAVSLDQRPWVMETGHEAIGSILPFDPWNAV